MYYFYIRGCIYKPLIFLQKAAKYTGISYIYLDIYHKKIPWKFARLTGTNECIWLTDKLLKAVKPCISNNMNWFNVFSNRF